MPANAKELRMIDSGHGPSSGDTNAIFRLDTNDTAEVVEADGYFDGLLGDGIKAGDIIHGTLDRDGTKEGKTYFVTAGGADVAITPIGKSSSSKIVPLTAATLAVTKATHDGKMIVVDKADGATITLPAATGSGLDLEVFVKTTITSNNLIIQVTGNDVMQGQQRAAQDGGDTSVAFETAADSDTITMNGTTKGGIRGDYVRLVDVAADLWMVQILNAGTGTEATAFSAAVA